MNAKVAIQRPQRWDNPFDPHIDEAVVDRILDLDMFREMDTSKFPPTATLRDIIRNDARIARYQQGGIIVRTGDYGTTAFYVISGAARVVLPPLDLPEAMLGRGVAGKRGIFDAFSRFWKNPRVPEVRDPTRYVTGDHTGTQIPLGTEAPIIIPDVAAVLDQYQTARRGPGAMFGEIAALTRSARTTTVFAEVDIELVEIRRQGIRDICHRVGRFRERVNDLYRQNTLKNHFDETPLFQHLSESMIERIAAETLFETYGDFDWHVSFNRYLERPSDERLAMEPVIVREGDYPDGLLMIISGSARVTRKLNHGQKTQRYIGAGALFGFEEITHNWRNGEESQVALQSTLRCVGYTDILRVPTAVIEELVLPDLPDSLLPPPLERRWRDMPIEADQRRLAWDDGAQDNIDTGTLEVLVENRYINGTATMIIDLDRCVRCDACVEACAMGHNNNPRFIRHGRVFDHYMVANACMHCADPVCMIGCPTGAIYRNPGGGEVVINDDTCIGCSTCATNCPYDNIRMVEIRDEQGDSIRDSSTNMPIVKATKCDLCLDLPGGPACQQACPHDALGRVHMQDMHALERWMYR